MRMAMISRNNVIAACTPSTDVSRSRVMSLIITFMFEPAKLQMNCASASGARNLRRAAAAPASTVVAVMAHDGGRADRSFHHLDRMNLYHRPGSRLLWGPFPLTEAPWHRTI